MSGCDGRGGSLEKNDALAQLSLRDQVFIIEDEMFKHEQVECPVRHHFSSQGVYAREMFIPKGTLLTGKIHKYEQLNILSAGEMSVLTEDGVLRVQAPFHVVSPPGTKRIAFAHTDCVWTTIHATRETDVEKLEAHFVVETEAQYVEFLTKTKELPCPT